jgi:hypothetical protein
MKMKLVADLAMEAKALVVRSFRNGLIEGLHAGKPFRVRSQPGRVLYIQIFKGELSCR